MCALHAKGITLTSEVPEGILRLARSQTILTSAENVLLFSKIWR